MNSNDKKTIIFICSPACYHATDWYKSAKSILVDYDFLIVSDVKEGEGLNYLLSDDDKISYLLRIDWLLTSSRTPFGNIWRNFLKLFLSPLQVILLRRELKKHKNAAVHAHGMYFMFLAALAGVRYVGTPQGSEILVRPDNSLLYRLFSKIALLNATYCTVDSIAMQEKSRLLYGNSPILIQNGINLNSIQKAIDSYKSIKRFRFTSIRGFAKLYRIDQLLTNRNDKLPLLPLTFIYPFADNDYMNELKNLINKFDENLGRLDRNKMYTLLAESKVVFSIPRSDSSPRSVYEAIFLGCVVVITYQPYYDNLPDCMKERIVIADLTNGNWLSDSIRVAEEIATKNFSPTNDACELFDQEKSFLKLTKLLFS